MFTSRLPKSTSVRRPSNPNDGTSFLHSNIPVSVRKANLFTPQPERSHSLATSTARKSYMTTDKKYPRTSKPMPDNDEQMQMFKSLVDFIKSIAPNFPVPEAKRFFSSVSSTEASRIFEILICQLISDFKIKKVEIDVPELLAKLDYPYIKSVTKSSLVSITTRQSIVNLLVIYDWLVNFIKATDINIYEHLEDGELTYEEKANLLVQESLRIDQGPKGEEWLYEELKKLQPDNNYEVDLKELQDTNAEIEQMEEDLERIQESEASYLTLKSDLEKCEKYNADMRNYLQVKLDEDAKLKQECKELDLKLKDVTDILEDLNFKTIDVDEQELATNIASGDNEMKTITHEIEVLQNTLKESQRQHIEQMNEEERQIAEIKERHEKMKNALLEEIKYKTSKLKEEEEKDAELERLNFEYIQSTLEINLQRAKSLVQEQDMEAEYWAKVRQTLSENNEVAKKALKMFRG